MVCLITCKTAAHVPLGPAVAHRPTHQMDIKAELERLAEHYQVADVGEWIERFTSPDSLHRTSSQQWLLLYSQTARGLDELTKRRFDVVCEQVIDDALDSRRDVAVTCLSRMMCKQVTQKLDWDQKCLDDCLRDIRNAIFAKHGKRPEDRSRKVAKIFIAMRLFALREKPIALQGGQVLSPAPGWERAWVQVALACKDEFQGLAMLLLESFGDFTSLRAFLFEKAEASTGMLRHALSKGDEREQLAAMHVLSSVLHGLADLELPLEAREWLRMLQKENIVEAVIACVKSLSSVALQDSTMACLMHLSNYQELMQDFGKSAVMGALIRFVMGQHKGRAPSVFDLLQQVLTSEHVADSFTVNGGHSVCLRLLQNREFKVFIFKDIVSVLLVWLDHGKRPLPANAFAVNGGFELCLRLLEVSQKRHADEDAKLIFALLAKWSERSRRVGVSDQGPLDLSVLVSYLKDHDAMIVNTAGGVLARVARLAPSMIKAQSPEALTTLQEFLAKDDHMEKAGFAHLRAAVHNQPVPEAWPLKCDVSMSHGLWG